MKEEKEPTWIRHQGLVRSNSAARLAFGTDFGGNWIHYKMLFRDAPPLILRWIHHYTAPTGPSKPEEWFGEPNSWAVKKGTGPSS